jgi:hypothetical protein
MVAAGLALAAAGAACGGGGGSSSTDAGGTSTTAPATTAAVPSTSPGTTVAPVNLTLHITDVHLANSEESDNGVRVLLPAGVASASVTLTGVPSPNQVVSVCQANSLDQRLTSAVCRTPAPGDSVTVPLGAVASGVEILQVGVNGTGAAANAIMLSDVAIRYTAGSRDVNVRLPQIAAGDAGGHPMFALTPAGASGAYKARLTWTVIQVFGGTASTGQLELVQGGTASNHAEGSGLDVSLTGNVTPPGGEAAIRIGNIGSGAMVSPKVALTLP